jgi:hypothetical protein
VSDEHRDLIGRQMDAELDKGRRAVHKAALSNERRKHRVQLAEDVGYLQNLREQADNETRRVELGQLIEALILGGGDWLEPGEANRFRQGERPQIHEGGLVWDAKNDGAPAREGEIPGDVAIGGRSVQPSDPSYPDDRVKLLSAESEGVSADAGGDASTGDDVDAGDQEGPPATGEDENGGVWRDQHADGKGGLAGGEADAGSAGIGTIRFAPNPDNRPGDPTPSQRATIPNAGGQDAASAVGIHPTIGAAEDGFLDTVHTIGAGVGKAVTEGGKGAVDAVGIAAKEMANNEDLHKGLEFGAKAAGVAMSYAAKKTFLDAVNNYIGIDVDKQTKNGFTLGQAAALAGVVQKAMVLKSIYDNYYDLPKDAANLGEKFNKAYKDVYGE